jgi:hypothetical protein
VLIRLELSGPGVQYIADNKSHIIPKPHTFYNLPLQSTFGFFTIFRTLLSVVVFLRGLIAKHYLENINSSLFKNKLLLASLGCIFRVLFILPAIIFSNILGMPCILFVWYPVSSCILYIIISNFELVEFRLKHLFSVFVSSLLFTIVLKELIVSTILFAVILVGAECFIFVLIDYILAESLYILAILPLSNIADPDQVAGVPFNRNNNNRRLGVNLATALDGPQYKNKDMSQKMVGRYGVFILGAIQNSTRPEAAAINSKLLNN